MLSNENQNVNIENLKLATTKKRIQAFVIDDLAITFIVTLIMWDTILQNGSDILSVLSIINNAFIQIVILKFFLNYF